MSELEPRRWWILPVLLSATFMYGFDGNAVNVAIPSLQQDLHAGQVALELVVGGYAFSYAMGLVTGGRLGDLLGHRRMFLTGMAGFTVASVLCGLSQNSAELVGARFIQGLTAAVMVPQVLALITSIFPATERPKALSWFGVVMGLCGIAGQVLGGLLLTVQLFDLGWRVIFFVNLPIGIVVFALAWQLLPRVASQRKPGLDPVGVVGISGAIALALVPLVIGREEGWPAWTFVSLGASVVVMAAALLWERRLANSGGQPLLDLALFRIRSFNTGLAINIAFMAFFASSMFTLSLLLQTGLGLTALQAGLTFVPLAVLAMATSLLGRPLVAKYGLRTLTFGSLINVVGVLLLVLELHTLGGAVGPLWMILPLAVMGFGQGLVLPSLIGATLSGIRPEQAGVAAGALTTTQQFAGAAGLAAIGVLYFATLGSRTGAASYASATEIALWVDLGVVVVMTVLTLLLPKGRPAAPAPAPAAKAEEPAAAANN